MGSDDSNNQVTILKGSAIAVPIADLAGCSPCLCASVVRNPG